MNPTTLKHSIARAKVKAARAAAIAYRRRCSWVSTDDLESEAWEGILKAPDFDPARAPVLSGKKQRELSPEEQVFEQAFLFYRRVGIRWLSSKVAKARSPVTVNDEHGRHHLHGHVTVEIDETTLEGYPSGIEELETEQWSAEWRSQVAERFAELMGQGREGEMAAAFLLRADEEITAADVASLFDATPRQVYKAAEKAKAKIGSDRTMLRLFERLTTGS